MPIDDTELHQLTDQAIALLQALIPIPAYSREEHAKADKLEEELSKLGLQPQRVLNNLILGRRDDSSRPVLLLNSHIDTVRPVETWTFNPHEPVLREDKIFGLGTNDAGASVVCLAMAYSHLCKKQQAYQLIFAASAEEEISGQNGILRVLEETGPVQLAIVGEPTGMQMAIAEKGLMVIDAVSKGQSGHAARDEGINAIYEALPDIEWIRNYRFEKVSDHLGASKATVTVIHAGKQHNVVPDSCHYVIDVRSNELYTNEEMLHILQSGVKSVLTPRSLRLKSSGIPLSHPVVQRGLSLGLSTYGSPTLSDQALMPNLSLKIGPGQSARSHTADEFILIEEIKEGIRIYIELLDGLEI
ncbi:MAG TPA: M20/M25/M40 family metallo-hydrolase [Saprospiraceae bacterium]|nr:M20/M25/M40 family metallo-hydrolase [Saprospiraceae bacterium]